MNPTVPMCRGVVESLHDGLYVVDLERNITYWNRAAERISGFSADEVVGSSCANNILTHVDGQGEVLCHARCPLAATMADGKMREARVYMHHRDGCRVPVSVRTSALLDDAGQIAGAVELFVDISDRAAAEERVKELEELAFLDGLTRLANRRFLERAIRGAVEESKRTGVPFGFLFMDIDHFKRFNDTYGHAVGDVVLQAVAGTLIANSRPFDLYGRWGGEEFVGLLRNVGRDGLASVGERVRTLVGSAYVTNAENRLHVTISVGATAVRLDDSVDSLVERADSLLYESKRAGRNRLVLG